MEQASLFQALLLGIIEGLTEFIPVSSTGHLILFVDLLNFQAPPGKVFEIVIQLGAILAICWLYRAKLFSSVINCTHDKTARHFLINIVVAFLPAAILGVLFHDFIKSVLFSPKVVAISLIVGGFIIILIEKYKDKPTLNIIDKLPYSTALKIGFFQTIAMIPGVSRSGATIMGGLLLGLDRKTAAEFSFFLAIPTLLGASVYSIYKSYDILSFDNYELIVAGFLSAFFSALLVIKAVISFISTHGYKPFAYYRIAVGILILGLLYAG